MKSNLNRLNHALNLWKRYLQEDSLSQFDRWLAKRFKENSKFGKKDRRAYSEILFSALRWGHRAVYELRKEPQNFKVTLEDFRQYANDLFFEKVLALTEGDQSHLQNKTDLKLESLLLEHSIPIEFLDSFRKRIERSKWDQKTIEQFLEMQTQRAPLWIRVRFSEDLEPVCGELKEKGFQIVETKDLSLHVKGEVSLQGLASFNEGRFAIQDYASSLIGLAVQCRPGDMVWDVCAGAGGKSLLIASCLRGRGAVHASDTREHALKRMKQRVRQSGHQNIRVFTHDATTSFTQPLEIAKRGGFDWVLVDAPCSSSGTWRRNPDAKLRHLDLDQNWSDLQSEILSHASKSVKVGGGLVYSTCSWLVEENESVAERFCASHENFSLKKMQLLGCPQSDSDTTFVAHFERNH